MLYYWWNDWLAWEVLTNTIDFIEFDDSRVVATIYFKRILSAHRIDVIKMNWISLEPPEKKICQSGSLSARIHNLLIPIEKECNWNQTNRGKILAYISYEKMPVQQPSNGIINWKFVFRYWCYSHLLKWTCHGYRAEPWEILKPL